MPQVTYDTNVFIKHRPAYFPRGFVMSAVVIQELAAGPRDNTRLKELDAVRRFYEKEGRRLTPTGDDWWLAGKVLNSLYRIVKPQGDAEPPPEQMRIVRDVLIARTAKRAGAIVITANTSDFERIHKFFVRRRFYTRMTSSSVNTAGANC